MSDGLKRKRVTFKHALRNKKIIDLLEDFYTQVERNDQKTRQKIKVAISSLYKYPLQINSGGDCIILQGFDNNLCRYVDEKLFQKNETTKNDVSNPVMREPDIVESKVVEINDEEKVDVDQELITNLPDTPQSNSDKQKSVCDAFLVALYIQHEEHPARSALTKNEVLIIAQQYLKDKIEDFSFIKLLEKKRRLVEIERVDGIELYKLTYIGNEMVKFILKHDKQDRWRNARKCSHTGGIADYAIFIDMPPESYKVITLVDKNEPEMLAQQTKGSYQTTESRSLKVGDISWVARSNSNGQELVLPFILERKRMDDFAASIKDGRFHEQKFRLRKCGLRNVIYLIEDYKGSKHSGLSIATLNQAIANTRVQDGFLIKRSDSLMSTKRFLYNVTMWLDMELQNKNLRGTNTDSAGKELMTFDYFNAASSKTKPLTVKELFIKMLLQLKGLSVEKALAITNKYDSPKALMDAYENLDSKAGEGLLANLRFSSATQRVGPAISKVIYLLFNIM